MWHGPLIMALGMLPATILPMSINLYLNKKIIDYVYLQQMRDLLPALSIAAGMAGIVYCVNFAGLSDIATLCIQVPLGAVIYIAASWAFKLEAFTYLVSVSLAPS